MGQGPVLYKSYLTQLCFMIESTLFVAGWLWIIVVPKSIMDSIKNDLRFSNTNSISRIFVDWMNKVNILIKTVLPF